MNLELIQEINYLKNSNKIYTEIAEITGLARTSIVLLIRISKIFNTLHSQEILSLNENIKLLNATVEKLKSNFSEKEAEINSLNSLIEIDYNRDMLIDKSELKMN